MKKKLCALILCLASIGSVAQPVKKEIDLTQMLLDVQKAPVARMEVLYRSIATLPPPYLFWLNGFEHRYSYKLTVSETGIAQYWPSFKKALRATKIKKWGSSGLMVPTWEIILYDKHGNYIMRICLNEFVGVGTITSLKGYVNIELGEWKNVEYIVEALDNMRENNLLVWLQENFGDIFTYKREVKALKDMTEEAKRESMENPSPEEE